MCESTEGLSGAAHAINLVIYTMQNQINGKSVAKHK